MKQRIFSRQVAITLSIVTLLSHVWRGFLDAMFVLPVDFNDATTMQLAAMIFTALFAGWSWAIFSAWRSSRRGLLAAFSVNALVLLAVPVGWLFYYCPAACRATAGVFNLANTLNLALGLLTAVSLAPQLRQKPQPSLKGRSI